jgi:hypothetical protein
MGIVCRLAGHCPDPSALVWNDGMSHSHCLRCGSHLIRRSITWRSVPRGYRVVWRAPLAGETVWTNGPTGWSTLLPEAVVPNISCSPDVPQP